jgi:hypothetical protein
MVGLIGALSTLALFLVLGWARVVNTTGDYPWVVILTSFMVAVVAAYVEKKEVGAARWLVALVFSFAWALFLHWLTPLQPEWPSLAGARASWQYNALILALVASLALAWGVPRLIDGLLSKGMENDR